MDTSIAKLCNQSSRVNADEMHGSSNKGAPESEMELNPVFRKIKRFRECGDPRARFHQAKLIVCVCN